MFDTLYFYAAIAGCTVLAFQLVLMMLGWVDGGDGLPDGAGDVDMDSGEPGPGWAGIRTATGSMRYSRSARSGRE
ncbi:MAG TPA: hypothetical protein PKC18_01080 [Lacipirellulaceae bacterium]|nr:hypothetical protein [Lacipirellulaceae bacterium]